MSKKMYLGDGVYVDWNGDAAIVTTEDGVRAYNTIVMEPEIVESFIVWWTQLKTAAQEAKTQK